MKRFNNKPKTQQMFLLLLIFAAVIGALCLNGCGGKSCESPKCANQEVNGSTLHGISIPGCGGCLSSGKGCNSACWPQACKFVSGTISNEETGETKVYGLDIRYFGDGCVGCGQNEKSCYAGCINNDTSKSPDSADGFFYGSTDSGEKVIGCSKGNNGCTSSNGSGGFTIGVLENLTGVD